MVFIAFNQIVKSGFIEVWQMSNKNSPIASISISQTNFINIDISSARGKYLLEMDIDGEHISKSISII